MYMLFEYTSAHVKNFRVAKLSKKMRQAQKNKKTVACETSFFFFRTLDAVNGITYIEAQV